MITLLRQPWRSNTNNTNNNNVLQLFSVFYLIYCEPANFSATSACLYMCRQAARQKDMEKLALLECFETSVDKLACAPDSSPLTDHIRKIIMQPAELWLACTHTNAAENGSVEVVSREADEAPAADGFVCYVEAVSAEPLEYWLSPNCDVEFPNAVSASFENLAAENAVGTWSKPDTDLASVTACIHKVLCQPNSFWVISNHTVGWMSNNSAALGSLLGSPLCVPDITAFSSYPLPQLGSAYAFDLWQPQSSGAVHQDQTEVVANVLNGISVSFEFKSMIEGCTAEEDAVDFSNDAYFTSLMSKPVDHWLCNGCEKLQEFDTKMQADVDNVM